MISLILCSIFLFIFALTKHYIILCIDRVIIGIFQAFISIYLPLWCDQFGVESKKTLMMGLIQVAPPLGVSVVYFVTSLLIANYQRIFLIQTVLIFGVSVYLFSFSDKYFNSQARRVPIEIEETLNKIENKKVERQLKLSFFYNIDKNENKIHKKEDISFSTKLKYIFSEPLFIISVLILCGLFFIVTCFQYLVNDYILKVFKETKSKQRLFAYLVVGSTSPTLGLIVGGLIVDKIGGYRKKGALIVCLIFSFLSDLPAIPLILVDSLYKYAVLLWIYLFLGSTLIPTFQGIIIACLPKDIQATGNCFAILFYNLLGFFPFCFFYVFMEGPKKMLSTAQKATVGCTFGITILVIFATFIRFRKDEEYNKKMGREKITNIEELNDDDAITQGENSLGLNSKELITIEEQDFNDSKNGNNN